MSDSETQSQLCIPQVHPHPLLCYIKQTCFAYRTLIENHSIFKGKPIIVFRPDVAVSHENDETFTGNLDNFDELKIWVQEKCVPLVREITFENAEELTEEGLPFLILFHKPEDTKSIKDYKLIIEQQLLDEKRRKLPLSLILVDIASNLHIYIMSVF